MKERGATSSTGEVCVQELMDAAWAALISGRPTELESLERLLERPLAARVDAPGDISSLRHLQLLLAATERNLRILSGQVRRG